MPDEDARLSEGGWTFSGMADEFQDHAARHLPGYADVQRLVSLIASHVVPDEGLVADFGASTGETAVGLAHRLAHRRPSFVLYDADASMCETIRQREIPHARVIEGPLTRHRRGMGVDHANADLTLALWTLQFLPPMDVRPLLAAARLASSPTGALVVAAKTRHVDTRWQQIATAALDDYKAEMGVDPPEREAKTRSLRGTLHERTVEDIASDLRDSGWADVTVLWRWHVWTILGAWASGSRDLW